MKLLQINTTVNTGSTGRIAEDIGITMLEAGHESFIATANTDRPSRSVLLPIGSTADKNLHGLKTRLFDLHGFGSKAATRKFVLQLKKINPDIIHLHNIHGYYLNVEILFNSLKKLQKPVVWTLHDCWPFTGHCSYFDAVNCFKWKTECNHCPNIKGYPASWGFDNSKNNFYRKKGLFTGINHLTIVTPSRWLCNHVHESFLNAYPVRVIHNGINLKVFNVSANTAALQKYNIGKEKIILGVAGTWDKRKGLADFIRLGEDISKNIKIVLVGLTGEQIKALPPGIIGISHTESVAELAALYSAADVFVNPTYQDNFPTTNIEALACGTPIITYNTGGSPEVIDENTGLVVEKGDVAALQSAIECVLAKGKNRYQKACRERAERLYNKDNRFQDYLSLYNAMLNRGV